MPVGVLHMFLCEWLDVQDVVQFVNEEDGSVNTVLVVRRCTMELFYEMNDRHIV